MITLTSVPRQRRGFRLEQMDDESLLYHDKLLKTVYLNDSATVIWTLCDGARSVADIASLINQAYEGTQHDVSDDVRAGVEKLIDEGVLALQPVESQ
ncbi:MAG: PqqD family peptide modification chaperone [Tardiphaga sp.]|uniref:PqqD family peptide modification chaperone n=1 Tax=Tardiphaga sp. TaxID=1926292 RepID=UPI0019CD11E5|nr:PqqD family peptide modification chaperone [Tardiphaga sp.]MBC7582696.1 PqqD family peptide modification chaperone [Tardiphaga sp.]